MATLWGLATTSETETSAGGPEETAHPTRETNVVNTMEGWGKCGTNLHKHNRLGGEDRDLGKGSEG